MSDKELLKGILGAKADFIITDDIKEESSPNPVELDDALSSTTEKLILSTGLVVLVKLCKSFLSLVEKGKWDIDERGYPVPKYSTLHAAGADLYSMDTMSILPGETVDFNTGISLAIPVGWEGEVRGRSGLWFNHRVAGFNGTIDADYRYVDEENEAEVKISLTNHGKDHIVIKVGDRIGQIVFKQVDKMSFSLVEEMETTESERSGGFGSTGE